MRKKSNFAQNFSFMDKQTDSIIAKRFLKMEMLRRGISTERLQSLLADHGYSYTMSSVNSKISRGTFSATFLLQCLEVMKCDKLDLDNIITNYE